MAEDFAGRGIVSPRLDADLLVCHALGQDRVRLYMDLDRPLDEAELAAIRGRVARRRRREPVAYIVGQKEFYLRAFEVSPAVLVPRPETELLVDRALQRLGELQAARDAGAPLRVLDLCTGSGAIAVTLAAERPGLALDATDMSAEALATARRNAERHGVAERVRFFEGDLFEALESGDRYALIAANPPYVGESERDALEPEVRDHEPPLALFSGADGLVLLRRLCATVAERLEPGGVLLFEVGAGQAATVCELLERDGRLCEVRSHRDLAGHERLVEARRRSLSKPSATASAANARKM